MRLFLPLVTDLRELYQEVILDHARSPRNHRALEGEDVQQAQGYNPLCGDRLTVFVRVADGRVEDVAFQGTGCAISQASASVMTEALRGKTEREVEELFGRFHGLVTGESPDPGAPELGKMSVFQGVSDYPTRVKCAILAWHAVRAAMASADDVVTTE